MMNEKKEDFYTVREAAQALRVSEATVWRWAEAAVGVAEADQGGAETEEGEGAQHAFQFRHVR